MSLNKAFTNAIWIWTDEETPNNMIAPIGSRAFRKLFVSREGKKAVTAHVLLTADNESDFYVNGSYVASITNWSNAQAYTVLLNPSSNVFAIRATNVGSALNPAGVLFAMKVLYTDGTSDLVISDATWIANRTVPQGFEQPNTDVSSWPSATEQARYGSAIWGTNVSIPAALSLAASKWIWTSDATLVSAPLESRVFRRTIVSPKKALSARIAVTADDTFEVYVNGASAGTGNNWQVGYVLYDVQLLPSANLFAVRATNIGHVPNPAGLILAIEITLEDGSVESVVSDSKWRVADDVRGFELPTTNDAHWDNATALASYGQGPWGSNVVFPNKAQSEPCLPIPSLNIRRNLA